MEEDSSIRPVVYLRLRRFLCLCDISDDDERDEVAQDITGLVLQMTSVSSVTRQLFFVPSDESSMVPIKDDLDIDVYIELGSLFDCATAADA
jgi:hypothetical protein